MQILLVLFHFRPLEPGLLVLFGIGCLTWAYAVGALGNKFYAGEYGARFHLRGCGRDQHRGRGGYNDVLLHRCCL